MSEGSVRRLLIVGIGLVLVAVLVVLALRLLEDLGADAEQRRRAAGGPIPVETAPVQRGLMQQELLLSGTLTPSASFTVRAQVTARLDALLVDLGDEVKRGQIIARLDPQIFEQRLKESEAAVKVAEAAVKQARSQVGIKKRASERTQQLLANGISAEAEHEQAVADYESAVAAVDVAAAELLQRQAALASAQLNLQETNIIAEWDGDDQTRIVSERFVDDGASVQSGQAICSFIKVNPLYAELQVTEAQYGLLHTAQQAELSVDTWPGKTFLAQVDRVAPTFNRLSRQALVRLLVPNPDRRLKPGMYMRARIVVQEAADAVILPETALVSRHGESAVFMVNKDNTVSLIKVQLGIRNKQYVQVLGADVEGDVVTLGQHLIKDGSAVKVVNPK